MIHHAEVNKHDTWSALAAPLPPTAIQWRQDGRVVTRDGRHIARFVAFIGANTVYDRLDSVVPGEWDLMLELLPNPAVELDEDSNQGACSFKARLQILGVIREDVGSGKDYKQASTDAFKRVAVRFGIGRELYDYEHNWVPMDGDGKFARPTEDPATVYARRYGRLKPGPTSGPALVPTTAQGSTGAPAQAPQQGDVIPDGTGDPKTVGEQTCPKCDGRMWDNRLTKRNPKAPDFKCRDRSCDGVIWPPKPEKGEQPRAAGTAKTKQAFDAGPLIPGLDDDGDPGPGDDDIPF
jgi:hypothetical protein